MNNLPKDYIRSCLTCRSLAELFNFIGLVERQEYIYSNLLPLQGFRPEAKSRGGTLVARAYIKDSTYSTNMQSVYRKNLDLLEQGPRGIGR